MLLHEDRWLSDCRWYLLSCKYKRRTRDRHRVRLIYPDATRTNPLKSSQFGDYGSSTIGPFGYEEIGSDSVGFNCLSYSSEQLDSLLDTPWKAARSFAILANISNGFTMILLIAASCVSYSPHALKAFACLAFSGSVFLWLTFTLFASKLSDSPYNGSFYVGGGMAVIGALCSIVTGLLIIQILPPGSSGNYTVSPPSQGTAPAGSAVAASAGVTTGRNFPAPKRVQDPPEKAPDADLEVVQSGTETITETILPDGSRKIVKTTVNADGSAVVTETIVKQE